MNDDIIISILPALPTDPTTQSASSLAVEPTQFGTAIIASPCLDPRLLSLRYAADFDGTGSRLVVAKEDIPAVVRALWKAFRVMKEAD